MDNTKRPEAQLTVVKEIIRDSETINTYRLCSPDGGTLAPFSAGQFLCALLDIGAVHTSRPYSICSSPALAQQGEYQISVEDFEGSFAARFIHENWRVGSEVFVTAPHGDYYYDPRRDTPHIVCIAGGSGVTPFLSLARAVNDGLEDIDITLLFGNGSWADTPFKAELERLERAGRLRVVHILSDENREGCERGFIGRELIKRYAIDEGPRSVWICGPGPMYKFVDGELAALGIPERLIRHAPYAPLKPAENPAYLGDAGATYELTVSSKDGEQKIPARADESLLVAMERAGLRARCECRSGECGECRVRLLSGEVYTSPRGIELGEAEISRGYVRACYSFALGDAAIER